MAKYDKGFGGNIRIRPANVPIEWDEHKLLEFKRCAADPLYFIENYVYIKNVDEEELVLFKPRFYQVEMLEKMLSSRYVITKLPRQCGKTSLTSAVLLWHLIFNRNFSILVAAHKGDKARDVITNIKEMYEELPDFLQHGVDTWNKGSIKLETGSRIRSSATSGSSARGDVYNMVYLDEFAFVAKHVAEEFVKSVIPTISSGKTTKIFITSTPKGLNMFYDMWRAAVDGVSGYEFVEIKWNDVPGRDDKFRSEIVAQFGQEYFDQEYGAEFLGSSRTLIAGHKLVSIRPIAPIKTSRHGRIYSEPQPGRTYVATVDVSEGLGADSSACVVFDVTELPYTQAAVFQDNLIEPMALPGVVYELARAYNDALVLVEANFGQQVGEILHQDFEYENMVFTSKGKTGVKNRVDQISVSGVRSRVGLHMSQQSKRVGCSNLKTLIENDQLIVSDAGTYDELTRFVVKNKSYAADDGHDDLAMCLVMFGWMVDQGYVRETTDVSVRDHLAALHRDRLEMEMMPLGFTLTGDDDEVMEMIDRDPVEMFGDRLQEKFDGLFDHARTRGGLTEDQLHDAFMRDMFSGKDADTADVFPHWNSD